LLLVIFVVHSCSHLHKQRTLSFPSGRGNHEEGDEDPQFHILEEYENITMGLGRRGGGREEGDIQHQSTSMAHDGVVVVVTTEEDREEDEPWCSSGIQAIQRANQSYHENYLLLDSSGDHHMDEPRLGEQEQPHPNQHQETNRNRLLAEDVHERIRQILVSVARALDEIDAESDQEHDDDLLLDQNSTQNDSQ
jgi:hypothetical protein